MVPDLVLVTVKNIFLRSLYYGPLDVYSAKRL